MASVVSQYYQDTKKRIERSGATDGLTPEQKKRLFEEILKGMKSLSHRSYMSGAL